MRAMILAAGLGSRLSPLTDSLPKPLAPIAGVPNIVRLLRHLRNSGIREIVINTHHLAEVLEDALGDGSAHGLAIAYSREATLLGTGGGIKRALPLLGDSTFVVLNGDALFLPDIEAIVDAHRRNGAISTLVVRKDSDAEKHGAVGIDDDGRVQYLLDSGQRTDGARSFMFTGTHVLEPAIGPYLPDTGCIVRCTYQPLVESKTPLHGFVHGGTFFDIGTLQRYLEANAAVVTGRAALPGYEPSDLKAHIGHGVSLGRGCCIGEGTVLCDGAVLEDDVKVDRCVIMPGAVVRKDIANAVLMADGTVVPACPRGIH